MKRFMFVLNHSLRVYRRDLGHFYWLIVNFITDFINSFYTPIYYDYYSRDCDMCERSYVEKFQGSRKAYKKMKENAYEWAEGPMEFNEISKDEYNQRAGIVNTRDRILEAYENGNGTSIYV